MSRLVLLPASPRLASSSRRSCRSMASRLSAPPHRHDGRGDTIALRRFSALLACLSARHLIRAVRHRMATGFCACLVKLTPCLFPPHGHHRCRLLPARSPNPIYSSPYRLIVSSPRLLDTGDGGAIALGCLLLGSSSTAARFRLRSICAGSVEDGVCGLSCLLGYRIMYLSMGDVVARRFVSGL